MLRKNYKYTNKNKTPFRSHTDINNYNNFLLDLDKKNLNQHNYNKKNINIFVKENNKTFTKLGYGDPNFTGIHPLDALLVAIEQHLNSDKDETININNTNNINNKTN